jgi:hypothetical protein
MAFNLADFEAEALQNGIAHYFDPVTGQNTFDLFTGGGGGYYDVTGGPTGLKLYNYGGGPIPAELQSLADKYMLASPEAISAAQDPNGPGNNQGGSDFSNLMTLAAFIGGPMALTGGFGGIASGIEGAMGVPELGLAPQTGSSLSLEGLMGGMDPSWGVNPTGWTPDANTTYWTDTYAGGAGGAMDMFGSMNPSGVGGVFSGGNSGGGIMDWLSKVSPNTWLNLGGQLLGSGINYLGSTNAADAQTQAAQQQLALLASMYAQNRADLAPWREAGIGALGNLTNLTTPGYAFRQSEGEKGINRAAAARGLWDSGRTLKALDRFNQDYATQEFGNIFNRNASLAGLGQAATNTGVNVSQNYGQQAGNSMLEAANARASGYVGGANALSGGLSSLLNNFNQQSMLDRILGRV